MLYQLAFAKLLKILPKIFDLCLTDFKKKKCLGQSRTCIVYFMGRESRVSSTSWGESHVYRPLHGARVTCIVHFMGRVLFTSGGESHMVHPLQGAVVTYVYRLHYGVRVTFIVHFSERESRVWSTLWDESHVYRPLRGVIVTCTVHCIVTSWNDSYVRISSTS